MLAIRPVALTCVGIQLADLMFNTQSYQEQLMSLEIRDRLCLASSKCSIYLRIGDSLLTAEVRIRGFLRRLFGYMRLYIKV